MNTFGGILLIGLAIMLVVACIPGTLMMMAFAGDDGRATGRRLVGVAMLVAFPTLAFAGLLFWLGCRLASF